MHAKSSRRGPLHQVGRISVLVLLAILATSLFGSVAAIGVRPLEVTLNLRPGDLTAFQITLSPGNRQENVSLSYALPVQQRTGGVSYQAVTAAESGAHQWLQMERDFVTVAPGEDVQLLVEVAVPFDASGTHIVAMMIESDQQTTTGFVIRYAVHVNLRIDRPGLRPIVNIEDFVLAANALGQPELQTALQNGSPLLFPIAAEAVIRDQSRRVVERVLMYTREGAGDNRDTVRIFPNVTLDYRGTVSKYLDPGEYEIRLFVSYADGRQTIQTLDVTLAGDEFPGQNERPAFAVEPASLEATMNLGGAASKILQISNQSRSEDLSVQIFFRDIESDYPRSIFETLNFEVRGDQVTVIGADRQERLVTTIRSDRTVAPGGYYGYIDVVELPKNEKVPHWISIPVQVIVGSDWLTTGEVEGITSFADNGSKLALSIVLRNTGDIHLMPTARVRIMDSEGTLLETVTARLQTDSAILPGKTGLLVSSSLSLEPGEYSCEITVTGDGKTVAETIMNVVIE